jgi:hypothetical protein
VQEEAPVGGEVGMERDAEQALLGAGEHLARDVEHRGALRAGDPHYAPGLLEHPQRAGVTGRGADPDGTVEPGRDPLDVEVVRAALLGRRLRAFEVVELVAAAGEDGGRQPGGEEGAEHGGAY